MEFRQLQYVLAVAKEKNFTRAALKLLIAQPSLSQQVAKLEQEIGLTLFERGPSGVELTYAGQLFVEKAQVVVDGAEQLRTAMRDLSDLKKGRLVIGSLPMTGSHVMPVILPAFRERFPDIDIVLIEDTTANLEKLASTGETDLSLLSLPIQSAELDYEPFLEEAILLAVPANHPLRSKSTNKKSASSIVSLNTVRDEPFIVLKKGQGFREITFDLCRSAGFIPNVVFESNNIETIQSLVAAGMGVALVPQMVMRDRQGQGKHAPAYLKITDENAARSLVIGYRKQRYLSIAAQAFIATVKDVMKTSPELY
jgi:LysR family hydrogen peroxide-inducible transcriptional activator